MQHLASGCKLLHYCITHDRWIEQAWKRKCVLSHDDCVTDLGFKCLEKPDDRYVIIGPEHGLIMSLLKKQFD